MWATHLTGDPAQNFHFIQLSEVVSQHSNSGHNYNCTTFYYKYLFKKAGLCREQQSANRKVYLMSLGSSGNCIFFIMAQWEMASTAIPRHSFSMSCPSCSVLGSRMGARHLTKSYCPFGAEMRRNESLLKFQAFLILGGGFPTQGSATQEAVQQGD